MDAGGKDVLSVKLASQDNDLNVNGKISIRHVQPEKEQKKPPASSFEEFVFGTLQTSKVEIGADFSFKTKMDDIQFDSISFTGNIGYAAPTQKEQAPSESSPNDLPVQK